MGPIDPGIISAKQCDHPNIRLFVLRHFAGVIDLNKIPLLYLDGDEKTLWKNVGHKARIRGNAGLRCEDKWSVVICHFIL